MGASDPSAEAIETADEYGRRSRCFVDHRKGRFGFEICTAFVQNTMVDAGHEGLLDQPSLQDLLPPQPLVFNDDLELADDLIDDFLGLPQDASTKAPPLIRGLDIYKKLLISTEPLALGSDPETDLREYVRETADKRFGRPLNTWIPLVQLSTEKDEHLPSPSHFQRLHSLLQREIDNETLALPDGALELLEQLHRPSRHQAIDVREHLDNLLNIKPVPRVYPEPLTPPILPSSDDALPFIPTNDGNVIDLTSEPCSPVNERRMMIETQLEAEHLSPEPTSPTLLAGSSPSRLLTNLFSNSHPSGESLKLDVPVMISSSDPLCPDPLTDSLPLYGPGTSLTPPNEQETFFDEAFTTLMSDRASYINNLADQEQPNTLLSASRVQVPILDFNVPSPAWTSKCLSAEDQFRFLQDGPSSGFAVNAVPRDVGSESSLKWNPVPPKHMPISTKEDLPCSIETPHDFLTDIVPTLSSASFFPPRDEMAIVKMDEDVEMELDAEIPTSPTTASSDEMQPRPPSPCQSRDHGGAPRCEGQLDLPPLPSWTTLLGSLPRQLLDVDTNYLPKPCDTSATSTLVGSFMQLRGKQPKAAKAVASTPLLRQTQTGPAATEVVCQTAPMVPAKAPEFRAPEEKGSFLISLSLGRNILSLLEATWPPEKLIDVDFSRHDVLLGGAPSTGPASMLSCEADVVLSPRAGIVVTNLVKVRQRALPGSKTLAPLRERIKTVSQKYETLTVLVSESNPSGEFVGALSSSDARAYADFARFAVALDAGVSVLLVPGADATMAKWILNLMCRHSEQAAATERFLSARETPWECFLRQSGLNVVAAKVLSGSLLEDAGPSGLARYMITPVQERVAGFAGVLGEKAIRNSSERMDRAWG